MTLYLPKDSDVWWQIFNTENETICPIIGCTNTTSIRTPIDDMSSVFPELGVYLLNISSSPPYLVSDKAHKTNTQRDHRSNQNTKCATVFHRKGRRVVGFDLACLEVDLSSLSTFFVCRNNFNGGASKPYPNRKIICVKQNTKEL